VRLGIHEIGVTIAVGVDDDDDEAGKVQSHGRKHAWNGGYAKPNPTEKPNPKPKSTQPEANKSEWIQKERKGRRKRRSEKVSSLNALNAKRPLTVKYCPSIKKNKSKMAQNRQAKEIPSDEGWK